MARSSYLYNATGLKKARSSWTQSKSHKFSMPFGKLVPLGAPIEVLPGDTWKLDMGAIIRMLTPKAPLMDQISGDIYAYFVPNRLVFDKSKQFFGENESSAWTLNLSYTIPHIRINLATGSYRGNTQSNPTKYTYFMYGGNADMDIGLLDHFELPFLYINPDQYSTLDSNASTTSSYISINAIPFRGYQIIWNEDFRNPSVVDPMLDFNYDHSDIVANSTWRNAHTRAFELKPVMRYRDLFSSSLKAPQRGPSATLFLGQTAKLTTGSSEYALASAVANPISFTSELVPGSPIGGAVSVDGTTGALQADDGTNIITQTNLLVDLSTATSATVNQLRQSIALQHLYEMMCSAFRYNEYTDVFFGVRASDPVLDRPQQLGGLHFNFNIQQVLSTANSGGQAVGDTGAFGLAQFRGHIYTNSFTEHGFIYLFCVTRKEHTYVQGLDKLWRKREFLDFFQSPLQGIGNVDIKNSEVYLRFNQDYSLDDGAFSYTEPYYEYRYMQSKACGLMNPLHPSSLSFYSLTDVFSGKPYLNESFVSEDKNGLDNALVASASVTDQFLGEVYLRYQCSRVMSLYDVPGLTRI